ncbi:adenosylcobinamide-GDP ribazoletransferase [Cohnella panacarvi]|uniref:adenosylcobinamide-GDP ribazoletransferase n=1 Tax=Cohnella panacarvi TaxID=400776 RepID=UPI00047D2AE6|nr:adenosylcobinamide-GDP ribazoletransferase [Cohnella panacarvi]
MRSLRLFVISGLEALAAAFQFLTRIPIPVSLAYDERLSRRSVAFYPLVGAAIGLIVALAGLLLAPAMPPVVVAILLVAVWTLLSGGLHLDGLMDTADGLLSHRSPERMLEIMKDSRVGAMGVMACVFAVGLKVATVAALIEDWRNDWLSLAILVPVWSRAFLGTAIACWPYARQGPGLGALFRAVGKRHAIASGFGAAIVTVTALAFESGWNAIDIGWFLIAAALITYGVGTLLSVVIHRKLGGLTGDVYGALNECIEIGLLVALASYAFHAA